MTAALVTVSGLILGALWWWLAPEVLYLSDGERAFLRNSEGEDTIGVDGVYVALSAGLGLLSGLLVFLLRRSGGIGVVVGLALGSLLAGLVGRVLGGVLGPDGDLAARAEQAGRGNTFEGPLELHATIALLVWPLVALLAHLMLTALFGPRDPEPAPAHFTGWGGPAPQAYPHPAPGARPAEPGRPKDAHNSGPTAPEGPDSGRPGN